MVVASFRLLDERWARIVSFLYGILRSNKTAMEFGALRQKNVHAPESGFGQRAASSATRAAQRRKSTSTRVPSAQP